MKKTDLIMIVLVVIAAAVFYIGSQMLNSRFDSSFLEIYSNEELVYQIELNEKTNDIFIIDNELGYNKILINNGVVTMLEADCRDQICVLSKAISKAGETIVCLPHRVVVEIVGVFDSGIDAISN
ncbi:MAG: NusG domain II-containing protein [Clostridiales bacterium]|nr:NusG domain II-containing protein [Clostridiales bacterium]